MNKKIIETGLRCEANPKVLLMRHFLDNKSDSRLVLEKLKQQKCGRMPVPAKLQAQLKDEFGIQIGSVTRVDDEVLEKAYEGLEQDGVIRKWLSSQKAEMKKYAEEALWWNPETVIDVTGFLVYAIVKNERCRKRLMDYMKGRATEHYRAYQSSAYCDSPLTGIFPRQQTLAAMLCIGLLERIRTGEGDKEAYEAFLTIAAGGYKWVRKYVKQSSQLDAKGLQEIVMEADPDAGAGTDTLHSLCKGIIGLVIAEDLGTPIEMSFFMLVLFTVFQRMSRDFLKPSEPVEITEAGTCRCRKIMEHYHCNKNGWLAEDVCCKEADFSAIGFVFGLNPRKLQEIVLTENEVQQLFSRCTDISDEAVIPVLIASALCKYVGQLEAGYLPEEELKRFEKTQGTEEQKEMDPVRLWEVKRELERLQAEELRLRRERDVLAARADELQQTLSKKREQLEQMKNRQEHIRRELKELQNFVCYLTEHTVEKEETGEKDNSPNTSAIQRQKLDLERRRVVVIGGHENWQRRFREQFPMWQFLSADKNNFDAGCVRNKEIIIVNTAVLKHSCYYRIMAERSEGQMVLYVNGNNLERCMDELERQMSEG